MISGFVLQHPAGFHDALFQTPSLLNNKIWWRIKISVFLLINKNYSKYHEEADNHQCDFRLRVVYCSVILKNDKTGPNNTITVIGNNKQIYQHINEAIQLQQRKLFKNLCWWLSLSAQMHHRRRNSCDRRERGGDVITCFVCLITVTKHEVVNEKTQFVD